MKINLAEIDREQFTVKEGVFCGLPAFLVTPAIQGTKWTQANKHLRSSIWSPEGELLSAGFPKFTNAGENPEHFPMPASLDDALVVEKLDGSLAIFDWVVGRLSCRTRGVFSYETLDNAADFAHCMAKHPDIALYLQTNPEYSLLCEITTPNQRVVLDYGSEIDLTLIGEVAKHDYSLSSQNHLDFISRATGVKRPRYFTFTSLDHLLADVKTWEGLEGCVIYSSAGMHKAKADSYLRKHRFKERVSVDSLLDLWFAHGSPDLATFQATLARDFDFECSAMALPIGTSICEAHANVIAALRAVEQKVKPLRELPRRDAALAVETQIPQLYQWSAFKMLSNRPVDPKQVRRLMEAELEVS